MNLDKEYALFLEDMLHHRRQFNASPELTALIKEMINMFSGVTRELLILKYNLDPNNQNLKMTQIIKILSEKYDKDSSSYRLVTKHHLDERIKSARGHFIDSFNLIVSCKLAEKMAKHQIKEVNDEL